MFYYYQLKGGEEAWQPIPAASRAAFQQEKQPVFITALSVSRLVEDLDYLEKLKLQYSGPFYCDWDSEDEELVIEKVNQFLDKLEEEGADLAMCKLFATGGRGYHLELPQSVLVEKVAKSGTVSLPSIYRELALTLAVDTLDLRIYSAGRGRMWRTPNVRRENGRYKVQISLEEMRQMTPELCHKLTAEPRELWDVKAPAFCPTLSIQYSRAQEKVDKLMKQRASFKPDPMMREKAKGHTVQLMMAGLGIKEGVGFQMIATQLAIAAVTAGLSEELFIVECSGLIENHKGDGNRYASPAKRTEELRRMYRYMDGNACYEFAVGPLKVLLNHSAPDLDGILTTKEDVKQNIEEVSSQDETVIDEYSDVARGVTLEKYGIYMDTENGKKRICALSFANASVLKSTEMSQIIGYDADVTVNGVFAGRCTLEVDVFSSLVFFNRFVSKYGHAFQGSDAQVRTVMMRFVEQAKKKGSVSYVLTREGLDIVSIPHHENPELQKPFMVWADQKTVITEPRITETGLVLRFMGQPDPRGVFKTDIAAAPQLTDWLEEEGNTELMKDTLYNLMMCQKPEVLGKLIGWYTACFYKQMFQKYYTKFPLLHINGPAGLGKCLGKDTPVLLADGRTVLVQDVRPGDQLLGPDGGARNVLSVCSGSEMLYKITPVKGDSYVVNESHILSLKKSGKDGVKLSDGTYVPPAHTGPVNVNVKVFADSDAMARKNLKGWRSDALEFNRPQEKLELDPYWLGLWLGDGRECEPNICKPFGPIVQWWIAHAESFGHSVSEYNYREGETSAWYVKGPEGAPNRFTRELRRYNLLNNKHIPDAYKFSSIENRLKLLAGLIDTDGHLIDSNFEWVSKYKHLAEDFAFIARSVGLACYITPVRKGIKSTGFVGDYWKCVVSGHTDKIPCLQKRAEPRQQIKRVTVTGIDIQPIGVGKYFGFQIDGDHLFLLGDFTVTHNTEMQIAISSLFFYQQPSEPISPGSTNFAISRMMEGSSSIPLILDEYKPHEMKKERTDSVRGLFRDAYNQRAVLRGGGTRESSDFRSLQTTQLAAPLVFIAEAAEDESAVMERVVLVTLARPPQHQGLKNLAHFQAFRRNHQLLGIIGQYLAAQIIFEMDAASFMAEFDTMYDEARRIYMLNEEDLKGDMTSKEMQDKTAAKERPVFNHTVAKFGFRQFRKLVNSMLDGQLDELMGTLEDGIYSRLSDMNASTTPEYVKVLKEISQMSYTVEDASPQAIRLGQEYAFTTDHGREVVEMSIRTCYQRYRMYCRQIGVAALFQSAEAFMHAIKDSPAFIKSGMGTKIEAPGVAFFDVGELQRLGVEALKFRKKTN